MKRLFIFFCLLATAVQSQDSAKFKLYGTFKDTYGDPLPGVNILQEGTANGTQTDKNGYYELFLPQGNHTIVYSFLAPKPLIREVSITKDTRLDITLGERDILLDEVLVSALRVTAQSPVTFTNLSKEEFAPRNLGQDIPFMVNFLPSVVTTSDAGAGIGYTGIRVRGSDATRVNVTINGIPYNDAESQGTFWVNLPDFASSVENLQLQRGVGTSTNGAGAFGASLNLLTDAVQEEAYGEISNSFGSFNSRKHTVKFSTGKLGNHFELTGRLSLIKSDGFVERASSDLRSYFLQGAYSDENTLIKALVFGGHEITYQAWFGVDAETLQTNRRFNPAGQQFDDEGNPTGFYEDQVDNYKQDHAQLLWNEKWSDSWSTNLALHYTLGRGFFEEYIDDWYQQNVAFGPDADLDFLGLDPIEVNGEPITTTDNVRRRWLDNDFYGTTFSANYKKGKADLVLGGAWNRYIGDHFGELIWARFAVNSEPFDRLYENVAFKTDFNVYGKLNYQLSEKISLFGDLQWRQVNYEANGELLGGDVFFVDDRFSFFNPKAGITYTVNTKNNIYFSYARANREPNRSDYENGNPRPEKLNDFELGWRYITPKAQISTNLYYMRYKDQLVLTGELDNSGFPIRANSGDSYRLGIEIDAAVQVSDKLDLRPNIALSSNKNIDFFFQRDGVLQNLGNTNISYSPEIVAGNQLTYRPLEGLQLSFLSKFVGEQYMGNIDAESSILDSYFVNDISIQYQTGKIGFFRSMTFSLLVNNVFDEQFESNGFFFTFDDDFTNPGTVTTREGAGFYPQAGINFLAGITLRM
ncbi:TonB-dependent receptor [Ascidiimonas aurantiaca]|uniref:TonB-dependent receptor n=1 Tax=Ascidiimonas aurantiaca TaxID=1685432 RepID=UPI0030EF24CC